VHLVGDSKNRLETYTLLPYICVQACQQRRSTRIRGAGRTDESAWVAFTRFGARTDVAYSLDVGSRKAKLVAFEYNDTVLDAKAQRWGDIVLVRVVIRVLYELE